MKKNDSLSAGTDVIFALVSLVLMSLSAIAAIVAVFVGDVSFANPLTGNMFTDHTWLRVIFYPVAFAGGCYGLYHGVKQLFTEDVVEVTVDSSGKVVDKDHMNGCIYQIMQMFLMPVFGAFVAYAIAYYILYVILAVGAFLLPYLLIAAMVFGVVRYALRYRKMKRQPAPAAEETAENVQAEPESAAGQKPVGRMASIRRSIGAFFRAFRNPIVSVVLAVVYIVIGSLMVVSGFHLGRPAATVDPVTGQVVEPQKFVATADGIGSLVFGKPFADNSNSGEGLYNRVEKKASNDRYAEAGMYDYTLWWNDEKVAVFTVTSASPELYSILVYSPRVSLENGLCPTMSVREAGKKKGVEMTAMYDEMGGSQDSYFISVTCDNANAVFDDESKLLSDQGRKKCGALNSTNSEIKLQPEDFSKDAKIDALLVFKRN